MIDLELKFVDKLIHESTLSARVYFGYTCGLLILALLVILISVLKSALLPLEKIFALIPAIFSAIPIPLLFMARSQKAALIFLKESWEDAKERGDAPAIDRLRTRMQELQSKVLEKVGTFK